MQVQNNNQSNSQINHKMVSLETLQPKPKPVEPGFSPARISFSSEFLDENNFISICPNPNREAAERASPRHADNFEFLSGNSTKMITADELMSEGKLLPFWQMHNVDNKLKNINLKEGQVSDGKPRNDKEEARMSWFLDDDPSPRPPKCTVLWKELLKLKRHRNSTLSPSSSSSSSSSSRSSIGDNIASSDAVGNKEKVVKRIKKGLEKTKSASLRIRPVVNVPICTIQGKSSSLPPLFPLRRGKLERL